MDIRKIESELYALSDKARELAGTLRKAREVEVWLKPGEVIRNFADRAFVMKKSPVGGESGHMVAEDFRDVIICTDCGNGITSKMSAMGLPDLFPKPGQKQSKDALDDLLLRLRKIAAEDISASEIKVHPWGPPSNFSAC